MNKYLTIVAVLYAPFANTTKIAISQPTIDLCQPTNCSLLDFNGEHHTRFKVLETRGAHKRAGVCSFLKRIFALKATYLYGERGYGSVLRQFSLRCGTARAVFAAQKQRAPSAPLFA